MINTELVITDQILKRTASIIDWHRNELDNNTPSVLRLPEKDKWKQWDNCRLWCSLFFSISSPGGSKYAREYLRLVEHREIEFELHPDKLISLDDKERISSIWEFGTGKNCINKRLARFFSKKDNINRSPGSLETKLNTVFLELYRKGFINWLKTIENMPDERLKAKEMEVLPGSKLKVSRDFLNNIGMTDSLIPLDIHILKELRDNWHWSVPSFTPSSRKNYERIEDAVREIARQLGYKVVEIDKAIISAHFLKLKSS